MERQALVANVTEVPGRMCMRHEKRASLPATSLGNCRSEMVLASRSLAMTVRPVHRNDDQSLSIIAGNESVCLVNIAQ
jgi:hypothetical protein